MKIYICLPALFLSACSQPMNHLSECEKWPLRGGCDISGGRVAQTINEPVDPVVEPPEVDTTIEEVSPDKSKHDNKGHGNGDEDDCHGRGCHDEDNPGHGHH